MKVRDLVHGGWRDITVPEVLAALEPGPVRPAWAVGQCPACATFVNASQRDLCPLCVTEGVYVRPRSLPE